MLMFATVEDLEARWRALTDDESERAEVLLADASAQLASMLAASGIGIDPADELQAANLATVCCAMVRRALDVADGLYGATQFTQTAGSYSESRTFGDSAGEMWVKARELQLLGIGRMRAASLRPAIHTPDGGDVDGW